MPDAARAKHGASAAPIPDEEFLPTPEEARAIKAELCFYGGHRRHPDPPCYWHNLERCAQCGALVESPMVNPSIWEKA